MHLLHSSKYIFVHLSRYWGDNSTCTLDESKQQINQTNKWKPFQAKILVSRIQFVNLQIVSLPGRENNKLYVYKYIYSSFVTSTWPFEHLLFRTTNAMKLMNSWLNSWSQLFTWPFYNDIDCKCLDGLLIKIKA